ncbi:Ca-activated chloride channel family protein [Pseudomonas delhiensis]|uniref:Ca-activated chloride channel family protein n=1 Tax=Pseudomonas delhiensis TaxID=366289 RepID=A0A239L288_9PSED|nr:VWA domain-containing protein [Pseudomonas delhiensis]SDK03421.1 Ca-activated chloride channel family protein [Pseudomonas delhiensis]SNT24676.1 Ca-activated chloride channel family protein [Pseudomonas delhiensis]
MNLWPHLLRPWWLLLLPLLAWLLWKLLHRQRRAGRWQLLLPAAFHPWLLKGGSGRADRRPWLYLGLAWLLAVLALLGPSWERIEQPAMQRSDPLVVILELTPRMLAGDLPPSRLEQARRKLLDLLRARPDAQTAIVVYAGSAHTLVPLSNDLFTARNLLDALKPSIMPEPGQRADLAVQLARRLLDQGAQGKGRLLLLTGGLDESEQQGIGKALHGHGRDFAILAVGSAGGAPIPQEDGTYLKDGQGGILLPRLDEAGLRRFAAGLDAGYQRLGAGDRDLKALGLLDANRGLEAAGNDAVLRLQRWADQGYWLLLPLLLLAACAGRRGWLFSLPLLLPLWLGAPQPALAFEFADLWLRPDQQGQRLLAEQRPADAARHFADFRWRGLALYQAGDYDGAAHAFAQGDTAADHYNRGNALARAEQYEAAIDAYERALELQPDLQQAQRNKALLEELLRQREQDAAQQRANASQALRSGEAESSPTAPARPSGQQDREERPARPSAALQNRQQANAERLQAPAPDDEPPTDATELPAPSADEEELSDESRQALEQWLRQIPDEPSELLRRKFWYQQQQHQENMP